MADQAFTYLFNEINALKQKAYDMKITNMIAVNKAKQELLDALSVEEVVELVFRKCPSYGEVQAFAALLRNGVFNINDLRLARERSTLFANVHESATHSSGLIKRMRNLIDDFEEIFKLATHPDSPDGPRIAPSEYELLNSFLVQMGFAVADQASELDKTYKKDQRAS